MIATILLTQNLKCLAKADRRVQFYGNSMDARTEEFFNEYEEGILSTISTIEKTSDVCSGAPIEVIGASNCYFVPVFVDKTIQYLITINYDNGCYSVSYSKYFAKDIQELETGCYYFYKNGDNTYLVNEFGNGLDIVSGETRSIDTDMDIKDERYLITETAPDAREIVQPRALIGRELSNFPIVRNGGKYGYCWLPSALSICKYFGSTMSLSQAHTYAHGSTHTLYYCNGGTINDAYMLIYHNMMKVGDIDSSNISAAKVLSSISGDSPVYMGLSSGTSSGTLIGHAAVICGYYLDNTSGQFTYIIADSNYSDLIYQVGSYSSSLSTYSPVSGVSYSWTETIYNLRDWN